MKFIIKTVMSLCLIAPVLAQANWQFGATEVLPNNKPVAEIAPADETSDSTFLDDYISATEAPVIATDEVDNSSADTGAESAILPVTTKPEIEQEIAPASAPAPAPAPLYVVSLEAGTLQDNIIRINNMLEDPWKIKWDSANDFTVTGTATVSGKDYYETMGQILQYYPVRAIFYKQNHVMAIVQRIK